MAIKLSDGRYVSGVMYLPENNYMPQYGDELADIREAPGVQMWCKGCKQDRDVVESHEYLLGHQMQYLCAECGWGITPCEPVEDSPT